jgi:hypothetical protein
MIELTGAHPPEHRLEVGDVVMVRRKLIDKETKKPFDWTYFAVIAAVGKSHRVFGHVILDEKDRERTMLMISGDPHVRVWYLPEEEWPDGIYAFRTKAILEGRLDDIV